ncbi:MAG: penicillin-insensitive murein endopeptidase [Gammaproteobacteria bacterium]
MRIAHVSSTVLIYALFALHPLPAAANAWSRVTEPLAGEADAIGGYTAGCLAGAVMLPVDGEGYQVMRLSRQRYFGHPLLVDFIRDLSRQVARQQHLELQIGDLGQARGGPTPFGHRSHQTGLDVDIWFEQQPLGANFSRQEREQRQAPSMVSEGGMTVNPRRWNAAQADILRLASSFAGVERIFVNAAIKKHLCRTQSDKTWLRKIRPWWGHDDHFHVRLHCPPGSTQCLNQEPVAPGDGCDAGLEWWFSAEARQPAKKPKPRIEPKLPAACEALLHETPRL